MIGYRAALLQYPLARSPGTSCVTSLCASCLRIKQELSRVLFLSRSKSSVKARRLIQTLRSTVSAVVSLLSSLTSFGFVPVLVRIRAVTAVALGNLCDQQCCLLTNKEVAWPVGSKPLSRLILAPSQRLAR